MTSLKLLLLLLSLLLCSTLVEAGNKNRRNKKGGGGGAEQPLTVDQLLNALNSTNDKLDNAVAAGNSSAAADLLPQANRIIQRYHELKREDTELFRKKNASLNGRIAKLKLLKKRAEGMAKRDGAPQKQHTNLAAVERLHESVVQLCRLGFVLRRALDDLSGGGGASQGLSFSSMATHDVGLKDAPEKLKKHFFHGQSSPKGKDLLAGINRFVSKIDAVQKNNEHLTGERGHFGAKIGAGLDDLKALKQRLVEQLKQLGGEEGVAGAGEGKRHHHRHHGTNRLGKLFGDAKGKLGSAETKAKEKLKNLGVGFNKLKAMSPQEKQGFFKRLGTKFSNLALVKWLKQKFSRGKKGEKGAAGGGEEQQPLLPKA